jgi:hypothetical protein
MVSETVTAIAARTFPTLSPGQEIVQRKPHVVIQFIDDLKGEQQGDVHEHIFWHNSDPKDAPRRNLNAVRRKDWRFTKHSDG